jgi:hypothetical protein
MFKRALQGREKVCGIEHSSTLDTRNEAEKIFKWALKGREKALVESTR